MRKEAYFEMFDERIVNSKKGNSIVVNEEEQNLSYLDYDVFRNLRKSVGNY